MFKDTTYLELKPYAADDRLIAIVRCDALSIRSPGSRSERQEIRVTVRTATVLPDGATLQLAAYAQGAPLMKVGRNYLIAAYRESTAAQWPWVLVEARPSSGTGASSREWEAAQAELAQELAPSASRGGVGPASSDVAPAVVSVVPAGPAPVPHTKQMGAAERLVLHDRAAKTSSHGLTLEVLGSEGTSGPPPKPGISRPTTTRTRIRVRVAFGGKTEELTFTAKSPGVASVTDLEWEGFMVELVDRTLVSGTRDRWTTTFAVTPTKVAPLPAIYSVPTVTVATGATATIAGLEIHVRAITGTPDTTGSGVLRVNVRLSVGKLARDYEFFDDRREPLTWNGYEIQYRGGTRKAVGFAVRKLGAETPTASATMPVGWSITYDDLSAFHLDGVFLRYRNDGEYVAQILVRGAKGVDELIFEGRAGVAAGALPAAYQKTLDAELVALPFAQLVSPPPRTLVPDTVVTSLTFVRTEGTTTRSTELRYEKGSGKDKFMPAATTLVTVVQKLVAEIQATTPKIVNRNIRAPTKLPR